MLDEPEGSDEDGGHEELDEEEAQERPGTAATSGFNALLDSDEDVDSVSKALESEGQQVRQLVHSKCAVHSCPSKAALWIKASFWKFRCANRDC